MLVTSLLTVVGRQHKRVLRNSLPHCKRRARVGAKQPRGQGLPTPGQQAVNQESADQTCVLNGTVLLFSVWFKTVCLVNLLRKPLPQTLRFPEDTLVFISPSF